MSAPSSSLASPSLSSLSLDAILEELTVIATSAKALEARRQTLLDALDQLVETGEADEQLSWNDYTITRRVRTSYTYPPSIIQQREQLKAAEKIAVALGDAETKLTTFWEVRVPKP